ncbi:MAG: acyl-CoA dehydrogenase family protein [Proteobacteria bacterium]|nr:acyl-CoA dehydrogenase family protein [Pseudomonadota bacterium]
MEETQIANKAGRDALLNWEETIYKNIYSNDTNLIHTIHYYFPKDFKRINSELELFGQRVSNELEALVAENHAASNLPRIEAYSAVGEHTDQIIHHPSYIAAGDIIYGSKLISKIVNPGGLLECLSLFFLSSEAGEAGHNCPIACSAGILRVFQKVPDFPNKQIYIEKLMLPSFQTNYTGAQFLTEVQGGSDVGLNAVYAEPSEQNTWEIYGEKWFCSNANADLFFITARFDKNISGTKGLGLFLIPAVWENAPNHFTLRRLKEKLGTRSMATAEIDFHGAFAYPMGSLEDGFHLVMENVLHISRLFNSFCMLGMARRAHTIASRYAEHRIAFSHPIIDYPLVKENLARIKAENMALVAGIFHTAQMQDQFDMKKCSDKNTELLLRLLVNIQKYLSAKYSVEHVHHSLDVLAGNGTIETFSSIPRLFRDSIVCENWEGTHNTLRMQVLKDILKYHVDKIYFSYMKDELNKFSDKIPHIKIISKELQQLEQDILTFRHLDNTLQALQIRLIVDQMAELYCALRLLFEALDQDKTMKSCSKMDCLELFCQLHIHKKPISYDKNYLELITKLNKS